MGLIMCLTGMFAGYTVAIIVAGYILIAEDNLWLKRTAVKIITLMLTFTVLSAVIGFIPQVWGIFESFIGIFFEYFYVNFIHRIFDFLDNILSLVRLLVFALISYKAFRQESIKIPFVDSFVEKHVN
jgi:uncharacterized membrane protein